MSLLLSKSSDAFIFINLRGMASPLSLIIHSPVFQRVSYHHVIAYNLLVSIASGGKELMPLILNDLCCHLQGKLEGRDIPTGPFKQLFQFLVESSFWEKYKQKTDKEINMALGDNSLFDIQHIRTELGIDFWDFSEWKTCKTTTEEMLSYMQRANSMVLLSTSQLSVLHALISVLILYEDNVSFFVLLS